MRREIGSEWDLCYSDISNTDVQTFLRSCRDCLHTITKVESLKTVLLPAYSCDSMITPFKNQTIIYYGINEKFELDNFPYDKLTVIDAVLIINYFGNNVFDDIMLSEIKRINPSILIIEDLTQNLFDGLRKSELIDYTVFSLRKWFALPDGGYLKSKEKLADLLYEDEDNFFQLKYESGLEKHAYLHGGNDTCYKKKYAKGNDFLNKSIGIYPISEYSRQALKFMDYDKIKVIRRKNFNYLSQHLNKAIIQLTKNSNSLYFPISINNRDKVQDALRQMNIFCPIIWELSAEICKNYPKLDYISSHILAIPIDQRYNIEDMYYICDTLNNMEV